MKKPTPSARASSRNAASAYAASFQVAYDALNSAQQQVVDTIEGPVLVVAGPGTGKTHVLTMRIANILRLTDTKPSSILALTFTESAAQNMRQRLAALIGPDAYYVQISTFHSFCAQVIANHLEYFPLDPASQPITDLERFELLRSIVQELPLTAVKPLNSPLFHVRSLMANISAYKREGVSPEALRSLIDEQWQDPEEVSSRTQRMKIAKQQQQLLEQLEVYEQYQQRLRSAGRYDFDDMLALTAEALSREEVLLQEYQEQYLYVLVDEYQDTNTIQNTVTYLLSSYWGEQANIFVVGDPHQSIYRFQGASLENSTQFITWYPQAKIYTLTQAYRCPSLIYDVARELIAKDTSLSTLETLGTGGRALKAALSQPLVTTKTTAEPLAIVKAPDQMTSLVALVENIKTLLDTGTPADEIAVLYTKNSFVIDLIPLLDKWSIPFYVEGGLDALTQPVVEQFMTLCLAVIGLRQGDDVNQQLFELCTYPWFSIDRVTLFQLGRFAGREHRSLVEVVQLSDKALTAALGFAVDTEAVAKMRELLDRLEQWGALDFQVVFISWLEAVIAESGLHHYLVDQSDTELEPLLALYSVFAFVKQLNVADHQFRLVDFVRAIETLREQHVVIPLQTLASTEERIRLSTVHKAKGQEWEYVFVLHVVDGIWGNRRTPASLPVPEHIVKTASAIARQSKEEQNQDDRRLLYVALTRAKKQVELWYPEQSEQEGVLRPRVPSIFISELDHRNDIIRKTARATSTPAVLASLLIGPPPTSLQRGRLEAYLGELVADFPLSITALNNYLRDPAKFLYQNVLSLPAAKLPHLAFGTAIHAALEEAGSQQLRSTDRHILGPILRRFDTQLQRELLTDAERERRRQRGHDVLRAYFKLHDFSTDTIWQTEYKIGYGGQAAFLDDIRLTGRMDRLDWNDDERKTVRVIDYKTGKARTRNEVLAATVSARSQLSEREQSLSEEIRGPYQRQLLFYRLLGQLDRSFEPEITLGTFDFVEAPFDAEKTLEHTFSLTDEGVKQLRVLIADVMREIRSLSFLDAVGDLLF